SPSLSTTASTRGPARSTAGAVGAGAVSCSMRRSLRRGGHPLDASALNPGDGTPIDGSVATTPAQLAPAARAGTGTGTGDTTGTGPRVRFQAPKLPDLDAVAAYFAESERTRWYANGGPCATLLAE